MVSGWKPTNLTSVFTYGHLFIATSWYYTEGVDTNVADVRWVCFLPPVNGTVILPPLVIPGYSLYGS